MNLYSLTALTAATTALALSDGTPVEFSKITSKGNIQVRVPTSHPLGEVDPLRIFDRDGNSTKNSTGGITLVIAEPAADAAAPAAPAPAAAAPASSNDNTVYEVAGMQFDDLNEAKSEALDLYDGSTNVEITAVIRKVVGVVGFTQLAA